MLMQLRLPAWLSVCFLLPLIAMGQHANTLSYSPTQSTEELSAVRISDAPTVDGRLTDACWATATGVFEGFFTQSSPDNGSPATQRSRVQVIYTDFAVYIGAKLYDASPDSILRELGLRDEEGKNTDLFAVGFDTYLNRQNAFVFQVSAAGVQTDIYVTPDDEDPNWNAVWRSGVTLDEDGWNVEMEIPYSAIRFPKEEVQTWGINFMRRIQRLQEEAYWHPVDPNINGLVNQFGTLTGIQDVKPPVRLQFTPYVSGYLVKDDEGSDWTQSVNGGMDLKYGINESFTLDVTLIPDFGQVVADDIVFNLSPFEVRFDENRPFFTEGTELFNRGDLFYSRRVGRAYGILGEVYGNEEIIDAPNDAPLINAAKLSGRTNGGLGIGFFNAVTNQTYATVEDTLTKTQREVLADPLTNFNVFVLDQNLKNNSKIAFINTNVTRWDGGRDANVTGTDFSFFDKKNTFNVNGSAAVSQIMTLNEDTGERELDLGYRYRLEVAKVSGRLQYGLERLVESHNYNSNDMGFLRAANEVSHQLEVSYRKNEPGKILNRYWMEVEVKYVQLHLPRVYNDWGIEYNADLTFKNFWNSGFGAGVNPSVTDDHFEARTGTRVFKKPASYNIYAWGGTDRRKRFYTSISTGFWERPEWNQFDNWFSMRPRYRFSNKFSIQHRLNLNWRRRELGFTTKLYTPTDELQAIIIGKRFITTATNVLSGNYTFNEYMGLNLRLRHYWSKVQYVDFFELDESGYLQETDYQGIEPDGTPAHNTNFNAWNIDCVYTWQFAPGSTMSLVWKNVIYTNDADTSPDFFTNLGNTLQSPATNSISLRILYFLDYLQVKRMFK